MDDTTYELVVFDGDETLVAGDVIHALAEYAGVTEEFEAIRDEVWRGDLDAMTALAERVFPLFEGLRTDEVDRVVRSMAFAPGARAVATNVTCRTAIFTALTPLADYVADELALDVTRANDPVVDDGVLTGEIDGDIIRRGKGPVLDDLVADLGIDRDQVVAVGDGPHDEPLFTRAGFSIGIDPKPTVRDVPDLVTEDQDLRPIVPALRERGVLDADPIAESERRSETGPTRTK